MLTASSLVKVISLSGLLEDSSGVGGLACLMSSPLLPEELTPGKSGSFVRLESSEPSSLSKVPSSKLCSMSIFRRNIDPGLWSMQHCSTKITIDAIFITFITIIVRKAKFIVEQEVDYIRAVNLKLVTGQLTGYLQNSS